MVNKTYVEIKVRKDEKIDAALKRFKRAVMKEGTVKFLKTNRYFVRPAEKRRLKAKAARRRAFIERLHSDNQ